VSDWKLKRTAQCAKCPWRKDVNPRDIPGGYCETRHHNLAKTIAPADPFAQLAKVEQHVMACHEMHDAHCVGWLMNQLGPGNNIMLRMKMRSCTNADKVRLVGDQHETFEDTLPCTNTN
jgi:hypothetical protein